MNIEYVIYTAVGIIMLILALLSLGRFLWRVPSLIDSSVFKDIGKFLYRIICKSGFMVIVVIFITYYICSRSPSLMNKNNSSESIDLNTKKRHVDEKTS